MPEHVHLLVGEPRIGDPSIVSKVLTRDLRKEKDAVRPIGLSYTGEDGELPRFWQARLYDFNVYSVKKKREKLEYMHANPAERVLVGHPSEWVWSSFSFHSGKGTGLVRIDPV